MAARRGHAETENLQKQDGRAAQDEPHPGGQAARSEKRYHAFKPSAGGCDGRLAASRSSWCKGRSARVNPWARSSRTNRLDYHSGNLPPILGYM